MLDVNSRAYRFGPTVLEPALTRFRFWAPACQTVSLEFSEGQTVPMDALADGWFQLEHPCGVGTRYRFRISPELVVPDPASRAQAGDVHDDSVVVNPADYDWQNRDWHGRPWHEAVIYELHVGALGGFAGVTRELPRLVALGVTAVELMPIADFPGARNWGYDGVLPYAPDAAYGTPEELCRLIDTAHGLGLMVYLDVVYNHFGPDGNYITAYAPEFYRHDRHTPWGDAIDFRKPQVRGFFEENALFWIMEYRFDGLRFDAVHAIDDTGFLQEMAANIRHTAGLHRHVHLVLENENNDASLLREAPDAPGYDAQWADDVHHCLHVMLTGEHEGYYEHFMQEPATTLARCLAEGFAFQSPVTTESGMKHHGTPSGHLPTTDFVICLQNHDQVGNRAFGDRLHQISHPAALRAATTLLLLTPQIPLLFMGQEWATTAPFLYFTSHTGELAEAVRAGRRKEFAHFEAFSDPAKRDRIPDPNADTSFTQSMPDPAEAASGPHEAWLILHRDLLAVRAAEIMPRLQDAAAIGAIALGTAGVHARWRMGDGQVLAIAMNLGDTPVPCPPRAGRLLFATTPRDAATTLPPYAAEVTLQESIDAG